MRRLLEAVLATAAGFVLGYGTGQILGQWFDAFNGLALVMGIVAGVNGGFAGYRQIYSWATPGGWAAFVLDSTWALISTTLGVVVNVYNSIRPETGFGPEFSVRQNRHVFLGGFALKRGFANTQGNVISNASLGRGDPLGNHRNLIERHEGLHVWQQRWFGPIHPAVYVVWGVLGAIVGTVFGFSSRKRRVKGVRIGRLVETAAYYDNPFEYWAYKNDGRWHRNSAQRVLKWGSFRWRDEE
jgi:hypothetical protein